MKIYKYILVAFAIGLALTGKSQNVTISNADSTDICYRVLKIYLAETKDVIVEDQTINIEMANTIAEKLPAEIEHFRLRNLLKEDIESELKRKSHIYLVRLNFEITNSDHFIVNVERFHVTKQKKLFFLWA